MIEKIIITSLFVFGYCCTFWEGMIFGNIGNWLDDRLPDWIAAPLYQCFICACMWWGTALYWVIWDGSVKEWLVVVISAMGLNAVLSKLFPLEEIRVKNEY